MLKRYDNGNTQYLSPNFTKIQVLSTAPNTTATGYMYYDLSLGIGVYASSKWNYASGGGGGAVSSVFGRAGVVTAQAGDYSGIYFPVPTGTTSQYIRGNGTLATLPVIGTTVNIVGVVGPSGSFITGSTTYTNAAMNGLPVLLFRNKLMEPNSNPGTGDSYFTQSGSTITFSSALTAGELIQLIILPA